MNIKNKKTLVIGASTNPIRYSYHAVISLRSHGHEIIALAKRKNQIGDVIIQTQFPDKESIHTVTMYIGAQHQPEYYNLVIDLQPKRVIFNPGTENPEFEKLLASSGIEVVKGCTLEMLSFNQY